MMCYFYLVVVDRHYNRSRPRIVVSCGACELFAVTLVLVEIRAKDGIDRPLRQLPRAAAKWDAKVTTSQRGTTRKIQDKPAIIGRCIKMMNLWKCLQLQGWDIEDYTQLGWLLVLHFVSHIFLIITYYGITTPYALSEDRARLISNSRAPIMSRRRLLNQSDMILSSYSSPL